MRRILDKFFPLGTRRRNFLYNLKKKTKQQIAKTATFLYKIVPLGIFKNIANNASGITKTYKASKERLYPKKDEYIIFNPKELQFLLSHPLEHTKKKIAVHVHLFYADLLEEFQKYLKNIPYDFDIYCSTSAENNVDEIKEKFAEIKNAKKIIVKKTPNIGRDYAPMVCEFGKELRKYDYICHIHTKKSLRMGKSQDEWRRHLLEGVLGSKKIIKNIFYMFENLNIGIYFPDSHESAPYWSNTWMGARDLGRKYLEMLHIPFEDNYQDFSVGSMFWLKTEAAKQVFNKKWEWEEFGEERGQADGTLAYVFERLFVICSNHNQYDFICYNKDMNFMLLNSSERNLHQYYAKNVENIFDKLLAYDVISFDIFDTLLTRKIYNPDDVFRWMDKIIKEKYKWKLKSDFLSLRKQAENSIRTSQNDPDIHQIYNEFEKQNTLTKKQVEKIKELEISLEKKVLIPRVDMLDLWNRLKKAKKKIIITSDMYLTSQILDEILKDCGYSGYEKIYVSSEINLRKDKGEIWNYIKEKYPNKKIIHVGDNEEADCHKLYEYLLTPEHVMSGTRMMENSPYGYFLKKTRTNFNIYDSVLYGLIINKTLFNSPFKWNESDGEYNVESLYEYGYCILGPILFQFMVWIVKSIKQEKKASLLFLAREGYYFQKMYDIIKNKCHAPWLKNVQDIYFLTSRRCASVANIKTKEDILEILEIEYYGDLYSLLENRFNLKIKDSNFNVILNKDGTGNREDVLKIIDKYEAEILKIAEKERQSYLKYIKSNVKNITNTVVVDLGYSGTIQMYLSKLLDQKISGKYLVVKENPKPLALGCKVESFYSEKENEVAQTILKNSLLFEAFLTAPYGQLKYFDEKGTPQYVDEKLIEVKKVELDKIFTGVEQLFNDFIDVLGGNIEEYEFDKEKTLSIFRGFLNESNNFIMRNREIFEFEDYFCRKNAMIIERIK